MALREAEEAVARGEALSPRDPVAAARLFRRAAAISAAAGDVRGAVGAWEREVAAWVSCGRTADAVKAARAALDVLDMVAERDARLVLMSNLAVAVRGAGLAGEAARLLERVVAEARQDAAGGASEEAASVHAAALVNLSVVRIEQGNPEAALALLEEADTAVRRLGDRGRLGTVRSNQAIAYSTLNRPRLARRAYAEAAALYEAAGAAPADVGFAVRGEAATLAQTGRFTEAIGRYRYAITLFERAGLPAEVYRTLIGEVMARSSLGQEIPAGELDALERRLAGMPLNTAGQMARNLGNIRLNQGDFDGADRLYRQAHRAFRRLGWLSDVASVDSNRATAARRAGDLDKARRLLAAARRYQAEHGRWLQTANLDHNLALVLEEIADKTDPPSRSLLRAAAARSRRAVAVIDRYRHDLGSAHDRHALQQTVYAGVFPSAIQLALRSRQLPAVATLVERARVQPVLASDRGADLAYLEPPAVMARPGDPPVGAGTGVSLADEAVRLGGQGAHWMGWWCGPSSVVTADTSASNVSIAVSDWDGSLERFAAALPIPLPHEIDTAGDDTALARRLALRRAARGPLIHDPVLAERLSQTIQRSIRERADGHPLIPGVTSMTDAALLWPLARLLLPASLRETLLAATPAGQRVPLILAPPPQLGRIPWSALPLADPAITPGAPRLIEAADLTVGLPVGLSRAAASRGISRHAGPPVVVADPLGDLRYARRLQLPGAARLGHGGSPATRAAFLAAAASAGVLVIAGHVQPGSDIDPAASAVLLAAGDGKPDPLPVADLAGIRVPGTCVLLGCDGAGAATGSEWTGIAIGLIWAGAEWVVTTTSPVIDDKTSTTCDNSLLTALLADGPRQGLWTWQRERAAAWRTSPDTAQAPYRWAAVIVTGSSATA